MNIFALHRSPRISAEQMCDKHVVKMIVETAQLLSTAHRVLDGHEYTARKVTTRRYHLTEGLKILLSEQKEETPELYDGLPSSESWQEYVGDELHKVEITRRYITRWAHPVRHMDDHLYLATHVNHPCAVWCRETFENYDWLFDHFCWLLEEYTYRYEKSHKCVDIEEFLNVIPKNFPARGYRSQHPLAMPDKYKVVGEVHQSYRNYYLGDKRDFAKWTKRETPIWWENAA